jgi:hypothetical protein
VTLSKLFDALIGLGLGVGVGVGVADGLADVGGGVGAADVASAAGSSSPHPTSSSDASPRATATLTGEEGTGEGYRLHPRIEAIKRSTLSSVATKGSLQSTVRCAWSLSFRCTQSTV